jgi:peptidoglycan/LPS O-acetylase OafA/YrhL
MRGRESDTFRPDIEGLRGLAVAVVVACHCGISILPGGFVGVDVFFVLSGYLITGLLVTEVRNTGTIDLARFYARRVRRLLPAMAVMVIATLLVGAIILAPQELALDARAAQATAVYVANVFFGINAADYFAGDVRTNPMLHMWSLAVEEQFYLLWPFLLMSAWRFRSSRAALAALLLAASAVSLAGCIYLTAHGSPFAFYGLHTRAWEFGLGGLASLIPRGALALPGGAWLAIGWSGLLLILGSVFLVTDEVGFPGWVALVPVIGTCAALLAGNEWPRRGVGVLLGSRPFQVVGGLSYSWYLWHWPFLVLGMVLLPNLQVWGKILIALAALLVAALTHRFLENPLRFHPYLVPRPIATLCLGAALSGLCLVAAFGCLRLADALASTPQMGQIDAAADDISDMNLDRCISSSEQVETCEFGVRTAANRVVLFGDSDAIQWFNAVERIAAARGWQLTTVVKFGCPAADLRPREGFAARDGCAEWRAAALQRIKAIAPGLVIMASATAYIRESRPADAASFSDAAWQAATRRTLESLVAAGTRVVAIRATPLPPFDVPTCLARALRHQSSFPGRCVFAASPALSPGIFHAEQASAHGIPGVGFIDMTPSLCDDHTCPVMRAGLVVYRDDQHLTGSFSASLAEALDGRLRAALASAP